MPFCPNCRGEFQDWVTVCPDCSVPLVDTLPEEPPKEPEESLVWRQVPAEVVHIASFQYSAEAHLARAKLESEGIPAFVSDEYMGSRNWKFSLVGGGVRLWVRKQDAEAALQVLEYRNNPATADENEEY